MIFANNVNYVYLVLVPVINCFRFVTGIRTDSPNVLTWWFHFEESSIKYVTAI